MFSSAFCTSKDILHLSGFFKRSAIYIKFKELANMKTQSWINKEAICQGVYLI